MTASPSLHALVIHHDGQSADQLEATCRNFHEAIGDPGLEFLAIDAVRLATSGLDPDQFDLIVLWLTNRLANDPAIMDWLDRWAEQRSAGTGGTLACLIEGDDPNWKLRLWELFTESIGAWRGIDFHCWKLEDDDHHDRFLQVATRHLRRRPLPAEAERLKRSFRLDWFASYD